MVKFSVYFCKKYAGHWKIRWTQGPRLTNGHESGNMAAVGAGLAAE